MRNRNLTLLLITFLLISTSHVSVEAKTNFINILNDNVNVREGPSTEYDVISQVNKDERYPLIDENDDWVQIDLSGQKGWVSKDFIEEQTKESGSDNDIVFTIENKVHLRKEATSDSDILTFAEPGDVLTLIEEIDDWYEVELGDETGYVYKQSIENPPLISGNALKDKTIIVDPGHGGYDVGAISASEVYEKDFTFTTSSMLKDTLETLGAKVIMTRDNDEYIRLGSRVSLSNLTSPDVFISIHYNSFPEVSSAQGISTYYYSDKDKALAKSVQNHLLLSTGAEDRDTLYENLQVLRHNKYKALLLELGFISNTDEESLLKTSDYQRQLVEGIISGLNGHMR